MPVLVVDRLELVEVEQQDMDRLGRHQEAAAQVQLEADPVRQPRQGVVEGLLLHLPDQGHGLQAEGHQRAQGVEGVLSLRRQGIGRGHDEPGRGIAPPARREHPPPVVGCAPGLVDGRGQGDLDTRHVGQDRAGGVQRDLADAVLVVDGGQFEAGPRHGPLAFGALLSAQLVHLVFG